MNTTSAYIIQKMIEYFSPDAKRINHALKVYGFAKCIAGNENVSSSEMQVLELAAILHDIGIKEAERKYNSCSGHYQEIEGPPVARQLLSGIDLDADLLERICFLIGNHHSYHKIDGIDFQILVEADFLVNIFEETMAPNVINTIVNKHFKTNSGKLLVKSMYL